MCLGVSLLLSTMRTWTALTRTFLFRSHASCYCVGAAFLPRVKIFLTLSCRIMLGRVLRTRVLTVVEGWLRKGRGGGVPDTPDAQVFGLRLLDSASLC